MVLKPTYSTPREPTYWKCFFCVFLQIFQCYDFPTCMSHDTNSSRYGSAQSPLPEIQHCSEWVLLRIMNYSIHIRVESRIPVVVGTIFMWAQSFAIFQLNTQITDMNHQLMIPKPERHGEENHELNHEHSHLQYCICNSSFNNSAICSFCNVRSFRMIFCPHQNTEYVSERSC